MQTLIFYLVTVASSYLCHSFHIAHRPLDCLSWLSQDTFRCYISVALKMASGVEITLAEVEVLIDWWCNCLNEHWNTILVNCRHHTSLCNPTVYWLQLSGDTPCFRLHSSATAGDTASRSPCRHQIHRKPSPTLQPCASVDSSMETWRPRQLCPLHRIPALTPEGLDKELDPDLMLHAPWGWWGD